MFNVSVIAKGKEGINKKYSSKTFRILSEITGHTYKDKWNGKAEEHHYNAPLHSTIYN